MINFMQNLNLPLSVFLVMFQLKAINPFQGCVLKTLSSCRYTILLFEQMVIAGKGSFSTGKSAWSVAITVGS